jgi:hypothetical protein
MRKLTLVAAVLAAVALTLPYATAQDAQHPPGEEEEGTDSQQVQQEGGGASLFPQVGAEVTVFYEEQGGKNVITRIGQAQE